VVILSCRVGENVKIVDQVTVTVLGLQNNQVRLCIGAPKNVPVHREEIYRRMQADMARASVGEKKRPTLSVARNGRGRRDERTS
jgi:carbon storage regulator